MVGSEECKQHCFGVVKAEGIFLIADTGHLGPTWHNLASLADRGAKLRMMIFLVPEVVNPTFGRNRLSISHKSDVNCRCACEPVIVVIVRGYVEIT